MLQLAAFFYSLLVLVASKQFFNSTRRWLIQLLYVQRIILSSYKSKFIAIK